MRCFTRAVLCFQTHFGIFKIICIFMEIVILVLETRKLDIVGSLLWIFGDDDELAIVVLCASSSFDCADPVSCLVLELQVPWVPPGTLQVTSR